MCQINAENLRAEKWENHNLFSTIEYFTVLFNKTYFTLLTPWSIGPCWLQGYKFYEEF